MTTDSKAVCGDWAEQVARAAMGRHAVDVVALDEVASQLRAAEHRGYTMGHKAGDDFRSAALASTAGDGAGDWARLHKAVESLNGSKLWLDNNHPWRIMLTRGRFNAAVAEKHQESAPGDGEWSDGAAICAIVNEAIRLCQSPAVPASPRSGAGEGEVPGAAACRSAREKAVGQLQTLHQLAGDAFAPAPAEHGVEIREPRPRWLDWRGAVEGIERSKQIAAQAVRQVRENGGDDTNQDIADNVCWMLGLDHLWQHVEALRAALAAKQAPDVATALRQEANRLIAKADDLTAALSQADAGRSERAVEIRELLAEIIHDHSHREQGILSWAELRKQNWLNGIAAQKARALADKLIAALHRSEIAGRSEKGEGAAAELARIRAVIPASLSYEVPDTAEAVASTFREYVKIAAEATAYRQGLAALSKGHALLCESGPDRCWVKIGFGWLQDAQDAHGALARFIKAAVPAQSPSTSDGEG